MERGSAIFGSENENDLFKAETFHQFFLCGKLNWNLFEETIIQIFINTTFLKFSWTLFNQRT